MVRSGVTATQAETFLRHFFASPPGLVLIAVAALGAAAAVLRTGRPDLPYVAAPALLTAAERTFYFALRQAVAADFQIFSKVRLGDLIQVERGVTGKRRLSAQGRIGAKHADFVLCDPGSFAARLVIELDDRSHQLPARQQRDQFFDAALKVAGVPLLRVPVRRTYAPDKLRQQIDATLSDHPVRRA